MTCRFIGGCVDGGRFDVGFGDGFINMNAGMGTNWETTGYRRVELKIGYAPRYVYVAEGVTDEQALDLLVGKENP